MQQIAELLAYVVGEYMKQFQNNQLLTNHIPQDIINSGITSFTLGAVTAV